LANELKSTTEFTKNGFRNFIEIKDLTQSSQNHHLKLFSI